MTAPHSLPTLPLEAETAVADAIGRLMHFWGFKRPMGRLWAVLYLSPRPLCAAELSETLKMSAGAVSMALAELEKWDAVERTWTPGDRRDFFRAEPDIWKMVKRVFQERELSLVRDFRSKLERASAGITDLEANATPDQAEDLSYKRQRLEHLQRLSEAGEFLLNALVEGAAIQPSAVLTPPRSPHREAPQS